MRKLGIANTYRYRRGFGRGVEGNWFDGGSLHSHASNYQALSAGVLAVMVDIPSESTPVSQPGKVLIDLVI